MTAALAGHNFYGTVGKVVAGTTVLITRPNNVNAYVGGGQVWGAAADARLAFPVPALPDGAVVPGFTGVALACINRRSPNDPTTGALWFAVSPVQFVTVLGDQQPLALTDAEIAQCVFQNGGFSHPVATFTTGAGTTLVLNLSAGNLGRRGIPGALVLSGGQLIAPSSTLFAYLHTGSAYNPLALEQITVQMSFSVLVKLTNP